MPSWIRSLTVQTSKFFLSDEREEVEMPLYARDDRPVRTRRLYIHDVDMSAQMTKETHGVGPNGDRWDGIDVIDEWYMGCVWMKTQPGNTERLLRVKTCSGNFGLETGPAVRTGLSVFDLDWLNGHPNRSGGSVETETDVTIAQYNKDIRSSLSRDGTLSHQLTVWKCAPVYSLILVIGLDRTLTVLYCGVVSKSLAVRLEMSSGSFLKSVSESNQDKLYDLPEGCPVGTVIAKSGQKRPFSRYAGEGSLFDVSPDIPGFHMRPAGGSVQQADTTEPPPPNYIGFNNPFFGTPIAFA